MHVADVIGSMLGSDLPIRVLGYDGSKAGPDTAETALRIVSPRALARLATAPGSLGLARAYVTGELEVEGDMHALLDGIADVTLNALPRAEQLRLARKLAPIALRHRVSPPDLEYRPPGRLHSKKRDSKVIAHHYDVSNTFYEWVLGPSMAYTCAVYPTVGATLEQAQTAKFELVANKLGLTSGMRLLDVGCGWGSMVMHAAAEHGVRALGVTLSRNQAEWAQREIERRGLAHLAEVRHLDYRATPVAQFDAVSSIGLTEHIGIRNYPSYFGALRERLRPGGRLLNHCITRADNQARTKFGAFVERYVFPDAELASPGRVMSAVHDAGLEVQHSENLRQHYALTLAAWNRNIVANWDDCVAEAGIGRARVWGLYIAASRLGFERNWLQLHQVLATRTTTAGDSSFPLRPDWTP